MSLLTPEEIDNTLDLAYTKAINAGRTNGGMVGHLWNHIAAEAIEQALIAKLSDGVELPEPLGTWHETDDDAGVWAKASRPVWDADQLRTSAATARVKALEDAAKLCETQLETGAHLRCAKAIRALKGEAP